MNKVSIERQGRNVLARLLGTLFPARKRSPEDGRDLLLQHPDGKILFIRPHQGLGDLLLATPVFRALKATYPKLQIHFLADTYNVIAIRDNRRLDKVLVWDKKRMQNPFHFWSFIRSLRAENYLLALPLSSHVPSFTSYLLARLCGARIVWAYDTTPFYGEAAWSRHLADLELPNRPEEDPEWVKFMELVRPLLPSSPAVVGGGPMGSPPGTGGNDVVVDYTPEFDLKEENVAWASDEWNKLKLPTRPKKIGLFFGGNPDRPERLWPAEYWGDLAVELQKNSEVSLVAIVPPPDFLSGSRALEVGIYPQISCRLSPAPAIFSESELGRVAAFLKGLDLFVCVDGGLFHIAVGARVNTLGLFFKTDPARWKPPVAWATVLRPADDQPRSITPEMVYQQICEMVLKSKAIPSV